MLLCLAWRWILCVVLSRCYWCLEADLILGIGAQGYFYRQFGVFVRFGWVPLSHYTLPMSRGGCWLGQAVTRDFGLGDGNCDGCGFGW